MDDKDEIYDNGYSSTILEGLNNLREQNQLFDITLKIGGRAFPAHKAVLAATSGYFRAMFTSGFKERNQSEIEIEFRNPNAFEILLEFAYTGRVSVTKVKSHMCDVFEMSLYMDFTEFTYVCTDLLGDLFRSAKDGTMIDEVCKILFLADDHADDLYCVVVPAQDFLMNNLDVLKDSAVFLENASVQYLTWFLRLEDLGTEKDEKQVSGRGVSWGRGFGVSDSQPPGAVKGRQKKKKKKGKGKGKKKERKERKR